MKYISWGGGLQSTCMAVMSALGDLPKVDAVIHADPGNEWSLNYALIEWYTRWLNQHGVHAESIKVSPPILDNLLDNHTHIPAWTQSGAPLRRQCTKHFKITPLNKFMRRFAGYDPSNPPHPKPGEFEVWVGFTLDEQERRAESRTKYKVHRWPLIELGMSRDDCTKYLHEHNLPIPPKSACVICPYRRASEWLPIRDHTPEEFQHAIEIDHKIRYLKPNKSMETDKLFLWREAIPLEDADLDKYAKKERQRAKNTDHQIIICDGGSCWT
jgi:hypothetical protein